MKLPTFVVLPACCSINAKLYFLAVRGTLIESWLYKEMKENEVSMLVLVLTYVLNQQRDTCLQMARKF